MSSGPLSIVLRSSGFLQSPALMVFNGSNDQTTFFHSEREDVHLLLYFQVLRLRVKNGDAMSLKGAFPFKTFQYS